MKYKNLLFLGLFLLSAITYLGVIVLIIYYFGWIPAIVLGLVTGFLTFKAKSIYENRSIHGNIIEKMEEREKEGVVIGGKKFYLNKEVKHADRLPGEKRKKNLGDLDQLGKVPVPSSLAKPKKTQPRASKQALKKGKPKKPGKKGEKKK